jgi:hypothetical protein
MDLVEGQPRRFANEQLEPHRVPDARVLHEHTIAALTHDGRLGRPQLVDTAPNRLNGGADRARNAVLQACLGWRYCEHAVVFGDRLIRDSRAEQGIARLLHDALERLEGCICIPTRLPEAAKLNSQRCR